MWIKWPEEVEKVSYLKEYHVQPFCKLITPKLPFFINIDFIQVYLKVGVAKIKSKKKLGYFQDLKQDVSMIIWFFSAAQQKSLINILVFGFQYLVM